MTTVYLVMCYSEDGHKFNSCYGVYLTKEQAEDVCNKNNEYEAIHHPNDDIVYTVETALMDMVSL